MARLIDAYREIFTLPEEDRLHAALDLLRFLLMVDCHAADLCRIKDAYPSISPMGARMLQVLTIPDNAGRIVSRQSMWELTGEDTSPDATNVHLSYLRDAIKPARIETVAGFGFRMTREDAAAVRAKVGR